MKIIGEILSWLPVRLLCCFRAGMYRESLASPITLTLLTENIKHETTVDKRGKEGNGGLSSPASMVVFITCALVSGKYGFTIGNELQDSRSGWFSYSSDVQMSYKTIGSKVLLVAVHLSMICSNPLKRELQDNSNERSLM
ncbi:uncharacterized protein Pyn_11330 [Prunus yedoensis var. nudiflora]|uniref:Uncharacterized protein n=1 Tax=Prunus yedoensis var. nudiflora TaxID=2094558 RepID=A0A314YLR9_PRUYE|nr:uncharacterized protein Pyn_11330 [Prunus yedoensis var. nudiflora]